MRHLLQILLILSVVGGCCMPAETDDSVPINDAPEDSETPVEPSIFCWAFPYYHNMELSTESVHRPFDSDLEYRVVMDYQRKESANQPGKFNAQYVGTLAYLVAETYEEHSWPNADKLRDALRNVQVVVTYTDNEFARLVDENAHREDAMQAIRDTDWITAMIWVDVTGCESQTLDPEVNMYIIVRDTRIWMHVVSILHEFMHAVAYYGFGDIEADYEHADERLWIPLNDHSFMAEVYDKWLEETGKEEYH